MGARSIIEESEKTSDMTRWSTVYKRYGVELLAWLDMNTRLHRIVRTGVGALPRDLELGGGRPGGIFDQRSARRTIERRTLISTYGSCSQTLVGVERMLEQWYL